MTVTTPPYESKKLDVMEHTVKTDSALPAATGLQMPEILSRMSDDERQKLNDHIRRKIDLRLLPMVILMYVMNYIDR